MRVDIVSVLVALACCEESMAALKAVEADSTSPGVTEAEDAIAAMSDPFPFDEVPRACDFCSKPTFGKDPWSDAEKKNDIAPLWVEKMFEPDRTVIMMAASTADGGRMLTDLYFLNDHIMGFPKFHSVFRFELPDDWYGEHQWRDNCSLVWQTDNIEIGDVDVGYWLGEEGGIGFQMLDPDQSFNPRSTDRRILPERNCTLGTSICQSPASLPHYQPTRVFTWQSSKICTSFSTLRSSLLIQTTALDLTCTRNPTQV